VSTSTKVDFEIEVPAELARLHLPEGVDRRLQDPAELLTLLRLRSSNSTPTSG